MSMSVILAAMGADDSKHLRWINELERSELSVFRCRFISVAGSLIQGGIVSGMGKSLLAARVYINYDPTIVRELKTVAPRRHVAVMVWSAGGPALDGLKLNGTFECSLSLVLDATGTASSAWSMALKPLFGWRQSLGPQEIGFVFFRLMTLITSHHIAPQISADVACPRAASSYDASSKIAKMSRSKFSTPLCHAHEGETRPCLPAMTTGTPNVPAVSSPSSWFRSHSDTSRRARLRSSLSTCTLRCRCSQRFMPCASSTPRWSASTTPCIA